MCLRGGSWGGVCFQVNPVGNYYAGGLKAIPSMVMTEYDRAAPKVHALRLLLTLRFLLQQQPQPQQQQCGSQAAAAQPGSPSASSHSAHRLRAPEPGPAAQALKKRKNRPRTVVCAACAQSALGGRKGARHRVVARHSERFRIGFAGCSSLCTVTTSAEASPSLPTAVALPVNLPVQPPPPK